MLTMSEFTLQAFVAVNVSILVGLSLYFKWTPSSQVYYAGMYPQNTLCSTEYIRLPD